jgi:hypothetical protein
LLPELGSSAILGGKTWDLTSFQLVSWFRVAFEGNEMIAYLTGCLQAKQLESLLMPKKKKKNWSLLSNIVIEVLRWHL